MYEGDTSFLVPRSTSPLAAYLDRYRTPLSWLDSPLAVLEVSAVGSPVRAARAWRLSLSIVGPRGEVLPESYTADMDPGGDVDQEEFREALGGADPDAHRAGAVSLTMATTGVYRLLRAVQSAGWPLAVAYAPLAWGILKEEFRRAKLHLEPDWYGLPQPLWLDLQVLDRAVEPRALGGRPDLDQYAQYYGVALQDERRERRASAVVVAGCLRVLARRHPALTLLPLEDLQRFQTDADAVWRADLRSLFGADVDASIGAAAWPG